MRRIQGMTSILLSHPKSPLKGTLDGRFNRNCKRLTNLLVFGTEPQFFRSKSARWILLRKGIL